MATISQGNSEKPQVPAAIRISLMTMFQSRPLETIVRLRTKKRVAMGIPAIGKRSLLRKALPSRIKSLNRC